jgi:type II secretory pathway pseudopilin PulG
MSIIFVLLGMVISSLLLLVAFNQFNDAKRIARIDDAKSQIASIIANAQRTYGGARQFASVTTEIALNSRTIPAYMHVDGGAQNTYNALVALNPVNLTAIGDGLSLSYPVDPADCQDVVQNTLSLTRQVTVDATVVKPIDGAIDLAALNAACAVAGPTVPVFFDFGFR